MCFPVNMSELLKWVRTGCTSIPVLTFFFFTSCSFSSHCSTSYLACLLPWHAAPLLPFRLYFTLPLSIFMSTLLCISPAPPTLCLPCDHNRPFFLPSSCFSCDRFPVSSSLPRGKAVNPSLLHWPIESCWAPILLLIGWAGLSRYWEEGLALLAFWLSAYLSVCLHDLLCLCSRADLKSASSGSQ